MVSTSSRSGGSASALASDRLRRPSPTRRPVAGHLRGRTLLPRSPGPEPQRKRRCVTRTDRFADRFPATSCIARSGRLAWGRPARRGPTVSAWPGWPKTRATAATAGPCEPWTNCGVAMLVYFLPTPREFEMSVGSKTNGCVNWVGGEHVGSMSRRKWRESSPSTPSLRSFAQGSGLLRSQPLQALEVPGDEGLLLAARPALELAFSPLGLGAGGETLGVSDANGRIRPRVVAAAAGDVLLPPAVQVVCHADGVSSR